MARALLVIVATVFAGACATTTTPAKPGVPIPTRVLTQTGPRILNGAIYAAGDLPTLKALVDAGNAAAVTQVGGVPSSYQCQAPFTNERDFCWPGITPTATSSPGTAYIAFSIQGGFCQTVDPPQAYVVGSHLELQVTVHDQDNCRIAGVMALPTAALIAISTSRLEPHLYSVDYEFDSTTDTYRSAETYLSIPSPAGADQVGIEADAASALATTVRSTNAGLFSESRVDGSQLGPLCGESIYGVQFLVIYLDASSRRMQVVLATNVPRTCTSTAA